MNSTRFYIHDPWNGKQNEYWDTGKIMKHINSVPGVTDRAVVVK